MSGFFRVPHATSSWRSSSTTRPATARGLLLEGMEAPRSEGTPSVRGACHGRGVGHRRTKAERESERAEADHGVWEVFRTQAAEIRGFADALKLVSEAPSPDSPGRRYYSNLGFFLQGFTVPGGSNNIERGLYLQLIERMDAAGELKPGAGKTIAEALRRAMKTRGAW